MKSMIILSSSKLFTPTEWLKKWKTPQPSRLHWTYPKAWSVSLTSKRWESIPSALTFSKSYSRCVLREGSLQKRLFSTRIWQIVTLCRVNQENCLGLKTTSLKNSLRNKAKTCMKNSCNISSTRYITQWVELRSNLIQTSSPTTSITLTPTQLRHLLSDRLKPFYLENVKGPSPAAGTEKRGRNIQIVSQKWKKSPYPNLQLCPSRT